MLEEELKGTAQQFCVEGKMRISRLLSCLLVNLKKFFALMYHYEVNADCTL